MKGQVTRVDDPDDRGRIQVRLSGHHREANETPWAFPCSPFAGPGYGWYCLPVIDDEVLVARTVDGTWIWLGFFWTGRAPKPTDGEAPDVRVFRTPVGHQLKFDEAGDVELIHSNGSVMTMRQNGDIEVYAAADIHLNGDAFNVVDTNCTCPMTGVSHKQGSSTVFSKGPF
jgi:hypothetical protein